MISFPDQQSDNNNGFCPNCGYPVSDEMATCPSCKAKLNSGSSADEAVRSELRMTVAVKEDGSETSTIGDNGAIPNFTNHKLTVPISETSDVNEVSVKSKSGKATNLKKTVADFGVVSEDNSFKSSCEDKNGGADTIQYDESSDVVESSQPEWRYQFECIDTKEHDIIDIVSKSEMFFGDNETILISGLRFKIRN